MYDFSVDHSSIEKEGILNIHEYLMFKNDIKCLDLLKKMFIGLLTKKVSDSNHTKCVWLYVLIMPRMRRRVNPHSIVAWMSRNSFARSRCEIWSFSDCNWTRTHSHFVHKRTLNYLVSLANWLTVRLWTKWLWDRVLLQSQNVYH